MAESRAYDGQALASAFAGRTRLVLLVLGVVLLGLWTAHRVPGTPPLEGDDVYVLGWAEHARVTDLIRVDPTIYPEWRPLAYATVWLQFQFTGLSSVAPYHAMNIAFWLGCVVLAGLLVYRVTGGWTAPAVTMAVLVTDQRWMSALIWIDDRQTTIACLLGLAALVVALPGETPLGRRSQALAGVLLLMAPLGKEYGLAFALSVAVVGVLERRRDLVWPAVSALVAYAAVRVLLVGGASQRYCEDVGFFAVHRRVCSDSPEWLSQVVYNIAATAVGSVFEGVFDQVGGLNPSLSRLPLSAAVVGAAALAWAKRERTASVGLGLVLFNAALSLMLYRARNQPIALTGCAVAAGIGFERLWRAREATWQTALAVAGAVLIAMNAALHGSQFHKALDEHRQRLDRQLESQSLLGHSQTPVAVGRPITEPTSPPGGMSGARAIGSAS